MSRRERQTNKTDATCMAKGRSARSQRPSVIAEAMRYEAVQGTTAMEPVDTPNSNFNAPARASVFSAFDSGKIQTDAFEAGRSNGGYPETVLVNDMAKQCSMVYRMSESDKTDVDPRDLHKLLPSTMLTSESLDLRSENKSGRGMYGVDVHKLMEDTALTFQAERKQAPENGGQNSESSRLSPTVEEREHGSPNTSNPAILGNETMVPGSPVTGWPATPVMGVLHPINHTLSHVTTKSLISTTERVSSNPLIYASTAVSRPNGTSGVLMDWDPYRLNSQQMYPPTSYLSTTSTPVILEEPSLEEPYIRCTHPSTKSTENEVVSSKASESEGSDPDGGSDTASKKFKSLEAALAWCHVQHSQKQVPVVPKDDVRKLVDFQLTSGKPIRAPWYRPQIEKAEGETAKATEKKMQKNAPRPKRAPTNKQGTGFFCPPGTSMTRV